MSPNGSEFSDQRNTIQSFAFKGVKISDIDLMGIESMISSNLSRKINGYYCLTDVGNLMMAQRDPELARAINGSTASIADGAPVAWFGKLIGKKSIERVSGVKLFEHLIRYGNYTHFLLGDTDETQHRVISKAKKENPNVRISGYSPPFKPVFSEADDRLMIDRIRRSGADIVWVSFGGGRQERWMMNNVSALDGSVMVGIGAAFKFYIGDLIIPSNAVQRFGLQWVTRVIDNPKKWIINGPLLYRIQFALNFYAEVVRAKSLKNFR